VEAERVKLRPSEEEFVQGLYDGTVVRSRGHAAFLSSAEEGIPVPLARLRKLTGAVPSQILIVSVSTTDEPTVAADRRAELVPICDGVRRVVLRYGFSEGIDVPAALHAVMGAGLLPEIDPAKLVYYLGRESYVQRPHGPGMAAWREGLFAYMQRNAERTASYFCVPPDKVIEIGTEIPI